MSNIQYGLISKVDADCLGKTIDLICREFVSDEIINTCQVGIFDGETDRGIYKYVSSKAYGKAIVDGKHSYGTWQYFKCNHTAIDNQKDKPIQKPFPECNLIIGNSNEVYNQLEDNSQHLIFVDGCHCFAHVISDFYCYAPKVKVGGYFAFHDTGKHIKEFKDFQHGDKTNPDAYISCRKALAAIGLLISQDQWFGNYGEHFQFETGNANACWQLIFDEAAETDEAGGICCFRKLY